jgi:seryl-tRNA synthetase
MLDPKLIRSDPDAVRAALERRGGTALADVDRFLELDGERLELLRRVESARAERNSAARAIAEAKGRGEDAGAEIARQAELKQSQAEGEATLGEIEAAIQDILLAIPNLPHPSAPLGDSEEDAEIVRMHGSPPEFGFPPRDHLDLAGPEGLGLIDTEAAGRVSGSRFHYLLGDLVRLEFALVQWGLAKLHARGFTPVIPPVLVKREAMVGTGFFPEAEAQVYALATDDLYLVGTAEVPLASLHGGEMLAAGALRRLLDMLPARGRRGRQGHARDLPGAPIRQARALQLLPPRPVLGRAGGAACDRGGDRAGARLPLPGRQCARRRPGRVGCAQVRHRGLATGPGPVPRADVVL